jgi:hypothetical protein
MDTEPLGRLVACNLVPSLHGWAEGSNFTFLPKVLMDEQVRRVIER